MSHSFKAPDARVHVVRLIEDLRKIAQQAGALADEMEFGFLLSESRGLLSIVPTLEFLSWRDAVAAGQVPVMDAATRKRVTMIIHIELAAIVVILLCAAIMARGGWV